MNKSQMYTEIRRVQKLRAHARYYNLQSILGNNWAIFFIICGGRKTGKSYSVADFLVKQKLKLKDQCMNYWMRISESSTKAMLTNKCKGLIDPDLQRKYHLELTHKDMYVFNHGEDFMTVCPLSQFAKLKGVGFYDKDYTGWYNIVLDEFQLEQGEKRTSFDILYNFIGMCENTVRTTKNKVRVFLLGNTLEEASTILKAFDFIPEKFGRYKLRHKKRCVIDNLEPTKEYLEDRYGSIADILGGKSMSNYTNELIKDTALISKDRLNSPTAIIKFEKKDTGWFTVWNGNVIKKWTGQSVAESGCIYMKPYLSGNFDKERRQEILDRFDARCFKFASLIDLSWFEDALKKIRKQ